MSGAAGGLAADNGGKATFVLTGATGFLGGHLMASLLERGDRVVVLGRPAKGRSLADRISGFLAWRGQGLSRDRVETVESDFLKPRCGLNAERYEALISRSLPIVHCASDTRFSELKRREITATNVHGLKEILALAGDSRAPFFHYVSTAYAAGTGRSWCPESPGGSGPFANVYEETKARAERDVAELCSRRSIPFTLIRPSIVYGDSRTGRSTRFNALYFHVKSLQFIRDIYLSDLRNNAGGKARAHGVSLDADGVLRLPLRIFLPRRGRLNLVPIDYFVAATLAIIDRAVPGFVYHVTSDRPKKLNELAAYCESFLKIKGIEIVYDSPGEEALSPPEALLDRFIEAYRPYLADIRRFDRAHTDQATGGLPIPELTYENFERCMSYAVGVDWDVDLERA
jgi:nucleoside-diphosphate-sugar epimerase